MVLAGAVFDRDTALRHGKIDEHDVADTSFTIDRHERGAHRREPSQFAGHFVIAYAEGLFCEFPVDQLEIFLERCESHFGHHRGNDRETQPFAFRDRPKFHFRIADGFDIVFLKRFGVGVADAVFGCLG